MGLGVQWSQCGANVWFIFDAFDVLYPVDINYFVLKQVIIPLRRSNRTALIDIGRVLVIV